MAWVTLLLYLPILWSNGQPGNNYTTIKFPYVLAQNQTKWDTNCTNTPDNTYTSFLTGGGWYILLYWMQKNINNFYHHDLMESFPYQELLLEKLSFLGSYEFCLTRNIDKNLIHFNENADNLSLFCTFANFWHHFEFLFQASEICSVNWSRRLVAELAHLLFSLIFFQCRFSISCCRSSPSFTICRAKHRHIMFYCLYKRPLWNESRLSCREDW